jgi:U32 family peptidase
MKRKIELLAPGGDIDSIKAAIIAGADAVYCGLDRFNARNRAENLSFEELNGILRLAHKNDCAVFLTLNIIIVESEIPALITLLNRLVNTSIDGVIVQDLGMFYLLATYFPTLQIHASTQLTTHNEGQIQFLKKLTATRVNLSRELNLDEIKELTGIAHERTILTEVFVHGSNCLSFSGICYLSSVHGGNSGNRGRCSQPCRNQYETTAAGKNFPLNLKDNSAYSDLRELSDAGIDSIKIEGRIKKFHYVHTVVNAFRKQLQRLYGHDTIQSEDSDLHRVFNRGFSNSFLKGDIDKGMFIDNPRDYSAIHRSQMNGGCSDDNIEQAKRELYDEKTEIIRTVKKKINKLPIGQAPLVIAVSGESGSPLKVSVKTPETSFVVHSKSNLAAKNEKNSAQCLNYEMLLIRFKALNATEYFIQHLDLNNLQNALFMPFQELTAIKKKILFILNGSKAFVDPIDVSRIKKQPQVKIKPTLSLLIASQKDLYLCSETSADIYFQLPSSFESEFSEFVDLFTKNKNVIPWFPSVVIGKDYHAAVEFLQQVQPKRIVTNNSGIAWAACQKEIPWIAGPYLNIVNSYSLLCLKENFGCYGSFISNELKRTQIKSIQKPDDFKLYYSIYHPITLLTSRQCLFHQVTGCEKYKVDDTCIQQCEKSSSITDLKKVPLFIEKTRGNYHSLYNEINFMNTEIVTDIPDLFSSFFIDLRDIITNTQIEVDKSRVVQLFEDLLGENPAAAEEEIKQQIHPSFNTQYNKGI